jgi:hypothetical protein
MSFKSDERTAPHLQLAPFPRLSRRWTRVAGTSSGRWRSDGQAHGEAGGARPRSPAAIVSRIDLGGHVTATGKE